MAKSDSSDPHRDAVAEAAGPGATTAFKLLGNETRMAILLALWEAAEPFADGSWDPAEGNGVSFSELRERVGVRDSGQFNYHLGKLDGWFLEDTPDGYQLLPAGEKIVHAVVASAGFEEAALDPTELDMACQHCGNPTAITFHNQRLYHVCTACEGSFSLGDKHPPGVLSGWSMNPAVLTDRTPEEIYTASKTQILHQFAQRVAGICPYCSGTVESSLHVCDAHDSGLAEPCLACGRHFEFAARFVCTTCKHTSLSALFPLVLHHPEVVAFYLDHGIELGYTGVDLETADWIRTIKEDADQELVSTDPLRIRFTVHAEDDELRLTLDETLNVVDVSRGEEQTRRPEA